MEARTLSALVHSVVFTLVIASVSRAQNEWNQVDCSAVGTAATDDPDCEEEIEEALQLLTCVANSTSNPVLLGCVFELGNNLEKLRIVTDGSAGAYMTTWYQEWRDNGDGTFTLRWSSTSSCNCILINPEVCPYPTSEPACSSVIMAAAIAHELCHAKSFDSTATLTTGTNPTLTYDDPCALATNEVLCHGVELETLLALIACVPPECQQDLADRYGVVQASRQSWQDQADSLGC